MKYIFTITTLFIAFSSFSQMNNEKKIGDKITNFSGIDENGKEWNSSNIDSNFLVVYFYPAAMTGGCTKQACAYRDDKSSFSNLGISVVAISGDDVENLKHFKDNYQLNFPLLSDKTGEISKLFGVPIKKGGSIKRIINNEELIFSRNLTTPRWTFVLNKKREIIYKNAEVNAAEDSKKVKEVIKNYLK